MKLKRLHLVNFLSHQDSVIEFEGEEVIQIVGQVEEDPEKSNGAGKTGIVEAILFVLYGRGRTNSSVLRRWGTVGEAFVDLTWVMDNVEYRVRRGWDSKINPFLTLSINGQDNSYKNIRETEELIKRILGISYNTFIASIFFQQQEADLFLSATPAKRKEYLREVLGLTFYEKCLEKVKKEAVGIEADLQKRVGYLEATQKELQQYPKESDLRSSAKEAESEVQKTSRFVKVHEEKLKVVQKELVQLDSTRKEYERTTERAFQINKEVGGLQGEGNRLRKLLQDDKRELSAKKIAEDEINNSFKVKKYKTSKAIVEGLNKHVLFYLDKQSSMQTVLRIAKEELKERKGAVGKGVCPTCSQTITSEYGKKLLEGVEKKIRETEASLAVLQIRVREYNELSQKFSAALGYNEQEDKKIQNLAHEKEMVILQIKTLEDRIESTEKQQIQNEKKLRDLKIEKERLEKTRVSMTKILSNLPSLQKQEQEFEDLVEESRKDVKEAISLQTELKLKLEKILQLLQDRKSYEKEVRGRTEQSNFYSILKKVYGKDGVSSDVIKDSVVVLEDMTNEILTDMTDGDISLEYKTVSSTGRDTLEVTVRTGEEEPKPYESYSGGEKGLLNFSSRFALSSFLSGRGTSRIEFSVLDEIFDQLDNHNRMEVMKIISKLRERFSQILMISHVPLPSFGREILVTKKGGVSRVD